MPASDPKIGTREEPFGYVCHRCLRCCHHKLIRLNPYEVARLARNRDQTTSVFQETSTVTIEDIGLVLRQEPDSGACVFLGPEGCNVHPDRPLACRVYPLGREMSRDGVETWVHAKPHPHTEGDYTVSGVIGDYIAGQDTDLYMQATDDYAAWVRAAVEGLAGDVEGSHEIPLEDLAHLTDPDTAIALECARTDAPEPTDIEARKRLHLEILWRLVAPFAGSTPAPE